MLCLLRACVLLSLKASGGSWARRPRLLHILRFLLPDSLSHQRTTFSSNASLIPLTTYTHTMTSLVDDAFIERLNKVYRLSKEGRVEECQEEALVLLKCGNMPRIHHIQTLVLLTLVLVG